MKDIATRALETIHQTLMIDEEWTLRQDRAFSWLAYRLRQDFIVDPPVIDADTEIHRVHSNIPLLRGVKAGSPEVTSVLAVLNRWAVGEALFWDSASAEVRCHTGAPVHEETISWRPRQVADFAIVALRNCEDRADLLAERFGGEVAIWAHPVSGLRQDADEMLWAGERSFAPAGQGESRFAVEADFQEVVAALNQTPYFSAGASREGVAIEVPFGKHDTALIQLQADARHPVLGSGLLSTLKVRLPESVTRTPADLANMLNAFEASGKLLSANFGAWCTYGSDGELLAHARFTPNLLYMRGLATDVAYSSINRAIWTASVLLGSEGRLQRDAAEIAMERLAAPESVQ